VGGDDAFDTIVLMAILMIFTPLLIFLSIPFYKSDLGGFNVAIEKTALRTTSEVVPIPRDLTTDDAILMLVVADRYTALPKKLEINMGAGVADVAIDNIFLGDRTVGLQTAAAAMPVRSPMKLNLFVDNTGTRFWQVAP
jgi:hypothetical protein